MNRRFLLSVLSALLAAIIFFNGGLSPASADDQAKAAKGPVKIFLLSGQSNMTGRGTLGDLNMPAADQKATLVRFVKEPGNLEKYRFLYEGKQKTPSGWTVRDDVFITMGEWPHLKPGQEEYSPYNKHGGLAPFYGGRGSRGFGPELGIGHALGDYYDEPVLLVKVAFGANSLAGNFRPPSSGGKPGDKYPLVVKALRDAIEHLPEIVPAYDKEQGYEIVGFFWNQGISDMTDKYAGEYEMNLVNLIKDLRKDLNAPGMKVVVAVTGNWGWDLADLLRNYKTQEQKDAAAAPVRKVTDAQVAVSRRPEFKGTVATAETRDFWRPREQYGGTGLEVHWQANGESYWLIGEAMGKAMVGLLGHGSHPTADRGSALVGVEQPAKPSLAWNLIRSDARQEPHVDTFLVRPHAGVACLLLRPFAGRVAGTGWHEDLPAAEVDERQGVGGLPAQRHPDRLADEVAGHHHVHVN